MQPPRPAERNGKVLQAQAFIERAIVGLLNVLGSAIQVEPRSAPQSNEVPKNVRLHAIHLPCQRELGDTLIPLQVSRKQIQVLRE